MDKRYQVFVSSTFQDLQEERQEVMQALLELDCIPAGMELFPAANQDQWSLIKKVIDDCDYYILISAGRYGSIGPDGVGYTEMEYRYALETGKPIMAFLHETPDQIAARNCEATDDGKTKLSAFRDFVRAKMVRFWDSPADLGSQVSRSLVKLIKAEPAVGWIKADALPSEDTTRELLKLRRRVDELEADLQRAKMNAPAGAEGLAQGADTFCIDVDLSYKSADSTADVVEPGRYGFETTWNAIFSTLAPLMLDDASDGQLRRALTSFVYSIGVDTLQQDPDIVAYETDPGEWAMVDSAFHTVIIQLRALGLIVKSEKPRSIRDSQTYWSLTPFGDETMTRLLAVKREVGSPSNTIP
jgi:hypothetical protein